MKEVYKVGAIIIKDKKLLVVKERGVDVFISVGGRPKKSETPVETLTRELKEELNVELTYAKPFGKFSAEAIGNYDWINMDAYFVEVAGEIKPSSEIEDFYWVGKDYKQKNIRLAPLLEKVIVPKLIQMRLIE
ncbi:MAG: NUDIX domain-containing protein [Candidatus Aenigmarchaeota archaeon]|nr:NUDIX domain-containing protein [Candidatus Aenigmarchaeota archaeon]